MEQEMLRAAQEAAWAGQSAAEAAWWALLLNGLAAAGAVGALWYAIVQGSRAARFERMRAAMELTKVLEAIGPVVEFLGAGSDDLDPSSVHYLQAGGVLQRAIDGVNHATLDYVPSAVAVSYLEGLRMALPSLKATLELPFLAPDLYRSDVGLIAEADDYLRLLRQVFLHNSWSARRKLRKY